jgi:hypothetical protein
LRASGSLKQTLQRVEDQVDVGQQLVAQRHSGGLLAVAVTDPSLKLSQSVHVSASCMAGATDQQLDHRRRVSQI